MTIFVSKEIPKIMDMEQEWTYKRDWNKLWTQPPSPTPSMSPHKVKPTHGVLFNENHWTKRYVAGMKDIDVMKEHSCLYSAEMGAQFQDLDFY